ncbi:benzoylformate decarboxylase [Polynucleobacter asymbioticus]|uniref:benzoylformate decarboxylase n=1 Tax=Polynucleobacter asymbioticus TaxID=576611 RepID=UPI0008F90D40|nr:benzoylformate decarboxylase [Polynucleobacter asymbioticus]
MRTVKEITFDLLRKLQVTTVVGNPGSTEETFLKDFPSDFNYVLALQEASVVAIADGLSQSLRKPVIVNIHTGAGLGNAMGCLLTAYQNKTPLIITAGQQTREMLLNEPLLTNIEAINMPKPWVKWSYEPARPEDVPGAFMRAYATAMQQPQGPVFLSLPLDDWEKLIPEVDVARTVSTRQGPDPDKVKEFAQRITASKNPLLIYGSDIARSQAWSDGIAFAERLNAPVWAAPFAERTPFPEDHPLFQGALTSGIGSLEKQIQGHDLIVVIGAPVFRYYPWIAGQFIPEGSTLLQVSDDPNMTSKAVVGDSLVSDSKLFLIEALKLIDQREKNNTPQRSPMTKEDRTAMPLRPHAVLEVLKENSPKEIVLVEECPSIVPLMQDVLRINQPDTFYTFASGGLGWDLPAAVGLALGEEVSGRNRPVVTLMGDGSFQYSVQGIYTGVQQKTHVIYVVFQNEEYGILKQFAELEQTPNVPGLDLPGLDIVAQGKAYGAKSLKVETLDELKTAYLEALSFKGTSVIVVPITKELKPLFG